MDKKRKKEIRKQFKHAEQAEARDRLGLTASQLGNLLLFLEDHLRGSCDHTTKLTRDWATAAGLNPDRVVAAMGEFGGFCDCEVLWNVTPDRFGWDSDWEDL